MKGNLLGPSPASDGKVESGHTQKGDLWLRTFFLCTTPVMNGGYVEIDDVLAAKAAALPPPLTSVYGIVYIGGLQSRAKCSLVATVGTLLSS